MHTPQDLMAIGRKLIAHCDNGTEREGLVELYTDDAVSVEAAPMPGEDSAEARGRDAILGKIDWWYDNHEVHSSEAEGPFVHLPDRFCVVFSADITDRNSGERTQMREVGTYYVNADGKIIREEFAYGFD